MKLYFSIPLLFILNIYNCFSQPQPKEIYIDNLYKTSDSMIINYIGEELFYTCFERYQNATMIFSSDNRVVFSEDLKSKDLSFVGIYQNVDSVSLGYLISFPGFSFEINFDALVYFAPTGGIIYGEMSKRYLDEFLYVFKNNLYQNIEIIKNIAKSSGVKMKDIDFCIYEDKYFWRIIAKRNTGNDLLVQINDHTNIIEVPSLIGL